MRVTLLYWSHKTNTSSYRPPPLPLLRRVRPLRAWTPLVVETRSLVR